MKIKDNDYNVLKTKIEAVVKKLGIEKIKYFLTYNTEIDLVWQLYHIQYKDEPELKLYDYLNDSHIETAIRKIIKELELL